jgi:hypothetical protein
VRTPFGPSKPSRLDRALRASLVPLACLATACGTLSSIKRDPLAALGAGNDKATLPVVVQRADAASLTATEVDRLLTATPVANDSSWPDQTRLSNETITRFEESMADHPYYVATAFRICPAIVWADGLATIGHDSAPSATSGPIARVQPNSAATMASSAAASAQTSAVTDATPSPSLLAAISSELGEGYAALQAKVLQLAALKAQQTAEELAQERKDLSDAEKKKHKAAAESLTAQVDKADAEIEHATDAYVASCRAAAAKVPAGAREHFVVALMNLRQAVADANTANAVAAVRYAQLVPEIVSQPLRLKDVLVDVAKASVSDYIFERTGKRLKLSSLQPAINLDNGKVALELNGISSDDLGNLKLDELLIETIVRTERFAGKVATLYVTTSEAGEKLDFEGDVLDGILDGFRSTGCKTGDPTKIPNQTAQEIHASSAGAPAKPHGLSFNPL